MLNEGIAAPPLNTPRSSVNGTKLTAVTGPAAFTDFHTPPPVVPTYTVLPVASAGSIATAVTRPLTFP
jgi:hypothetical protein